MKALIVEDDFTSRLLLQEFLRPYGVVHIAVNGREAIDAVSAAIDASEPYDLVCLDIMMPEVDGNAALKGIRSVETSHGIVALGGAKIVMTTAIDRPGNILEAFRESCDAYLVKPISTEKLLKHLRDFGLISCSCSG